jgi:uncharacterized glyoxalase superfamily protein PhnB
MTGRRRALVVLAAAGFAAGGITEPEGSLAMRKLAPVIFVEAVEPCIAFWVDRLGFTQTIAVPLGDRLGFAAVEAGGVEVMYQSRASIAADIPALADGEFDRTGYALFIEVDDLDALLASLQGVEVIVPERRTFYGAREVFVRAPCGSVVGFAEMSDE